MDCVFLLLPAALLHCIKLDTQTGLALREKRNEETRLDDEQDDTDIPSR